jgi:hypothetical protein
LRFWLGVAGPATRYCAGPRAAGKTSTLQLRGPTHCRKSVPATAPDRAVCAPCSDRPAAGPAACSPRGLARSRIGSLLLRRPREAGPAACCCADRCTAGPAACSPRGLAHSRIGSLLLRRPREAGPSSLLLRRPMRSWKTSTLQLRGPARSRTGSLSLRQLPYRTGRPLPAPTAP